MNVFHAAAPGCSYCDSFFLTQFKDAITRAGRAYSELQNLLRKVHAAERAVESAEQ